MIHSFKVINFCKVHQGRPSNKSQVWGRSWQCKAILYLTSTENHFTCAILARLRGQLWNCESYTTDFVIQNHWHWAMPIWCCHHPWAIHFFSPLIEMDWYFEFFIRYHKLFSFPYPPSYSRVEMWCLLPNYRITKAFGTIAPSSVVFQKWLEHFWLDKS